jgi:urease accessory protein
MSWHARLELDYVLGTTKAPSSTTVVQHRHQGPLRVFKSLYPEGPGICHNVIVHPPGGLVQGDLLEIDVHVRNGAHALLSTPGATRFYRCDGEAATQAVHLRLAEGARCEWLPLETIAYDGCHARNHLDFQLAAGAELIAWDVLCLGLPAANLPFACGVIDQRMTWPGVWIERARLAADDQRLFSSRTGLDGQSAMATLVLACGTPLSRKRREDLLEALRSVIDRHALAPRCGATSPDERLIVVRALAAQTEPLMELWQSLWRVLRREAWHIGSTPPRVWRV